MVEVAGRTTSDTTNAMNGRRGGIPHLLALGDCSMSIPVSFVEEFDEELEIQALARREAKVARREAKVGRWEAEVGRREAEAARREAEAENQRLRSQIEELRRQ